MTTQICFNNTYFFSISTIIILSILAFIIIYKISEDRRMEIFCKNRVNDIKKLITPSVQQPSTLKIVNQDTRSRETFPERRYVGSRDLSFDSQQVGYIYNTAERFPLYENRQGNKYYYHSIDDSRNGIRVVLDNPKSEVLSNDDSIQVPELGGGDYTVKLYEYSSNRYNPFLY